MPNFLNPSTCDLAASAGHCGFIRIELDFIINHDITYRTGREFAGDGEEE